MKITPNSHFHGLIALESSIIAKEARRYSTPRSWGNGFNAKLISENEGSCSLISHQSFSFLWQVKLQATFCNQFVPNHGLLKVSHDPTLFIKVFRLPILLHPFITAPSKSTPSKSPSKKVAKIAGVPAGIKS